MNINVCIRQCIYHFLPSLVPRWLIMRSDKIYIYSYKIYVFPISVYSLRRRRRRQFFPLHRLFSCFFYFILDKVHTLRTFFPLLVPDILFQVSGTGDFFLSQQFCFLFWSAAKATSLRLGRKSLAVICFVISYFISFTQSFLSCSLTSVCFISPSRVFFSSSSSSSSLLFFLFSQTVKKRVVDFFSLFCKKSGVCVCMLFLQHKSFIRRTCQFKLTDVISE